MADEATDPRLKQGFLTHIEETKRYVKRLGEVADKAELDAAAICAALAC
jgi:ferritin-like metal-binding protein YciE